MTEETKDKDVVEKKRDELSEQDLDKASGGGRDTQKDGVRKEAPNSTKQEDHGRHLR